MSQAPPYPPAGGQPGYPPYPGGDSSAPGGFVAPPAVPGYPPAPQQGYPPPQQAYPPPQQAYPPPQQGYPIPPQQAMPIQEQPKQQMEMAAPLAATNPNCPPGLEYLTQVDQLIVKQKVEILEIFSGKAEIGYTGLFALIRKFMEVQNYSPEHVD